MKSLTFTRKHGLFGEDKLMFLAIEYVNLVVGVPKKKKFKMNNEPSFPYSHLHYFTSYLCSLNRDVHMARCAPISSNN